MTRNDTATMQRDEVAVERIIASPAAEGQIILFEQWELFRRSWKWVLLVAVIGTIGAFLYAWYMVPKEYQASITVVPPNKSSSPLENAVGSISSSLKDMGFSKLVGGRSGESGYSRLAVLSSRSVVDSMIANHDLYPVYGVPRGRRDLLQTAVRENIGIDVDDEGPITYSIYCRDPKLAALLATEAIGYANRISEDLNRRETEPITRTIARRYDQVRQEQETLGAQLRGFMQKQGIFDVEKQPSLVGSAMFDVEAQVREQRVMAETFERILGPSDARTIQAKQILGELERETRRVVEGQGTALKGMSLKRAPSAIVEGARLQIAYEINGKYLSLLQPMYEQSILDQRRDIPSFQILDRAEVPLKKARPKYSLVVLGAFLGTFIVCYVIIALVSYFKAFMRRYQGYVRTTSVVNGLPRN